MPKCLIILNPGAEEIETLAVADILCRAGVEVSIAASAETTVAGSRGLPLSASCKLADVAQEQWDAVYLPGGFGSAEYARDTNAVQDVIEQQLTSGRIMAIICASPMALIPRGLGKGKRITCYPALRETLEPEVQAWVDQPVVWDGNLVTSQGPGTAMALGLSLAAKLVDTATAQQVASDMLVAWSPAD
ncbi:MAG: DJ-1/PfpI family protein [Planctomycetota bacterium]|nr:MAG: DJ-1/PfpI family protein [Planctomycetota bacterium]